MDRKELVKGKQYRTTREVACKIGGRAYVMGAGQVLTYAQPSHGNWWQRFTSRSGLVVSLNPVGLDALEVVA